MIEMVGRAESISEAVRCTVYGDSRLNAVSDSDSRLNASLARRGKHRQNHPASIYYQLMGNAVYEGDSGLSSAINVNGGYSSYSNCAFLAYARVLTCGCPPECLDIR